jgi:glycosyltransferase involved in cell wall biosynthesis
MKPISIIIINHNYSSWVLQSIQSAINQDYNGYITVYIVESGSTDDSLSKINNAFFQIQIPDGDFGFAKKISNNRELKLINLKKNLGPSFARNIAINDALQNSEYLFILDSDDEMYPNKVSRMLSVAESNRLIGVVYADYDILNMDTGVCLTEYKEPFDLHRLTQECIVHSGSMISKEALEAVLDGDGYYDVNMRTCEDYDLWIRIAKKFIIYHIPESLTLVRNHRNNSTNTVDKQIWEQNWLRIRQKNA